MFLTGVGIPILAALNGGLGARLGSPMAASVILFGLALLIALAGAAATESLGDVRLSSGVPPQFYFGGLFVAFDVIAVTFIAPRFGVGNAIFFVLVGQLVDRKSVVWERGCQYVSVSGDTHSLAKKSQTQPTTQYHT